MGVHSVAPLRAASPLSSQSGPGGSVWSNAFVRITLVHQSTSLFLGVADSAREYFSLEELRFQIPYRRQVASLKPPLGPGSPFPILKVIMATTTCKIDMFASAVENRRMFVEQFRAQLGNVEKKQTRLDVLPNFAEMLTELYFSEEATLQGWYPNTPQLKKRTWVDHAPERESPLDVYCHYSSCWYGGKRNEFWTSMLTERYNHGVRRRSNLSPIREEPQVVEATLQSGFLEELNPLTYCRSFRKAMDGVSDTTSAFTGVANQAHAILDSVSDIITKTKLMLFGVETSGVVMKFIRIIANALMARSQMLIPSIIFNVLSEFGAEIYRMVSEKVGSFRTPVNAILQGSDKEEHEDGGFNLSEPLKAIVSANQGVCAATLAGVLAIVLQCALGLPSVKSIDHAIKFFGDRSRSLKNIFDFSAVSFPMFTAIGDYLLETCFGRLKSKTELDKYLQNYDLWTDEVLELLDDPSTPIQTRLEKDVKLVFKIDSLYKRGLEYSRLLGEKKLGLECSQHFHKVFKFVEEARKLCDYTGVFGNRPRVKPLVVHLFGESGVGKSGMSWPFSCDLNAAMSTNDEEAKKFASEVYFRNTEQEFWDGYAGQNVVVYDDFGQRGDSQAAPNEEFMELIRAANMAPYPLHMAQLEEKRRTKFCSKAIILTSNVLEQNVTSLTFPDAYRRRVDVCARVTNKEEYQKDGVSLRQGVVKRLDPLKCDGPCDTSPYEMVLYNPESQQPLCNEDGSNVKMDYEEFLSHCLDIAKKSFRSSQAVNGELERRLTAERTAMLRAKLQGGDELAYGPVVIQELELMPTEDPNFNPLREPTPRMKANLWEQFTEQFRKMVKQIPDVRTVAKSLRDFVTETLSQLCSVKNALIMVGVIIGGLGLWQGYKALTNKSSNNITRHHNPHIVEAAQSGDQSTRKLPTLAVEASSSGDSITKRGAVLKVEATQSGDAVTKRTVATKVEATISGENKSVDIAKSPTFEGFEECHENIPKDPRFTTEGFASGDSRTSKNRVLRVEGYEPKKPDVEMQAWRDRSAQELITHRILSNLYKIIRIRDGVETPVLNLLFIRDTTALVPSHVLNYLNDNDTIRIENASGIVFEMPWKVIETRSVDASHPDAHKDAILWRFPRQVHCHTDIVKHFQIMPELATRRCEVAIPTLRQYGEHRVICVLGNADATMDHITLTVETGVLNIRDCIKYRLNTIAGDCGSPVICQETSMIRKIAGIHIAASVDASACYGQSVTRADLERALSKWRDEAAIIMDADDLPNIGVKANATLQYNVDYSTEEFVQLCHLPCPAFAFAGLCEKMPYQPNQTNIQPSIICGKIREPLTTPSILYDKEVHILHKNIAKCAINTPFIDREEVMRCVAEVKPHLFNGRDPKLARVLTFEEAVAGSTDSVYLGSIDRSSSPGYPWVLSLPAGKKGKTGWFGEDVFIYNEEVHAAVEERLAAARQGVRTPTVWTDVLKDERRPIEKVAQKKTRVFSHGPMDYTIAFRMYFLAFIAHIMENRIENEQSMGTNAYSKDWDRTAKKLSKFGKKVFAGDFSTFDGTLNSCIMEEMVHVINEWYNDGEENALIRRVLFMEVFNSVHLCDGIYLYMTHSQPSGNPLTTPLNSFYNSVSMRIAYYRAARAQGVLPPPFDEVVSMVSYGDDNVINFSDSVSDWFNQITVTDAFATFGMIYTDEAKTGNAVAHRTLEEVAYLKRGFRQDKGGRWRAPLSLDTILETPNWVRKAPDSVLACKSNVEDSCRELAQHDRETFDVWTKLLAQVFLDEARELPKVYTYDTYIEFWDLEK